MYRKCISRLLVYLLLVTTCVFAAPVGKDKAEKAYTGWIRSGSTHMGLKISQKNIAESYTQTNANGRALFHVLNLGQGGYAVISAEDRLEPIVAFSDTGTFSCDSQSPLYQMLHTDLAARLEACDQADVASSEETDNSAAPQQVQETSFEKKTARWNSLVAEGDDEFGIEAAPSKYSIDDVRVNTLVEAHWDQSGAENLYTPNGYVCGCVATAMALVMDYHQYPVDGIGLKTKNISVDDVSQSATTRGGDGAGGPYNWSQMPNYPNSAHDQVGALCYDAGVSVGMSYKSSGSGASMGGCPSAFKDWFGYAAAKNYYDYNSVSLEMIQKTVNANLDASYPVLFAVSNDDGAHAIVCDGYGFNGGISYHHINMGWGGSSDLWYNLPEISSFTRLYRIIYNVFPHEGGAIVSGRVMGADGYPVVGIEVTATSGAQVFSSTTNSKGIYCFAHIAQGNYTVTVSDDDLTSDSLNVSVGNPNDSSCPNSWGNVLFVSDVIRTADEDAYVRALSPDSNFGSSTNLNVQKNAGGEVFESYIKFDLSDVDDDVENAQLRISVCANDSNAQNQLFVMSDDSWEENSLTYNNRSAAGTLIADVTPTFVTTTITTATLIDGSTGNGNLDNDSVVSNASSGDTWTTKQADSKYYIAADPDGSGYYNGWTLSRLGTYPGGNNTIGMLTYAHALAFDSGSTPDFCAFANSGGVQVESDPASATMTAGSEVVVTFKGSTAGETDDFVAAAAFIFDKGLTTEATCSVTPTAVTSLTEVTFDGDKTGYVATYSATCIPTEDYSTVSVRVGVANETDSIGVALDDVALEYSTTGVGSADKLLCIDVSDAVIQELQGDRVVTFCVRGDAAGAVTYESRETSHPPQLVLSQSAEANSASDWEGDDAQPDGRWTYGYYSPDAEYTTFAAYPVHTTYYGGSQSWIGGNGVIWDHDEGYPRVGKYSMSPYAGSQHTVDTTGKYESVKRWTSNIKGIVTVVNDLQQIQNSGDGNSVTVRKNGTKIWSQDLEDSYRAVKSLELAVYPGDVIDFAVDPLNNHSADWIYWRVRITTKTPMANRSGLLGHYDFDEASDMPSDGDGDIYDRKMYAFDYSGKAKHGTLKNCDTWTVWTSGKIGNAIDLDGANDYVEIPIDLNPAENDFTVAAWVKGGAANDVLFSQADGQDWIKLDAYGRLAAAVKSSSGSILTAEAVWDASEWHHVALSWDGSRRSLYLDGVIVAVDGADMASPVSSSSSMNIGVGATLINHFDGMIDDLGIWSRSLSSKEVFSLWMSGDNDRNLACAKSYLINNTRPVARDVNVEVVGGSAVDIVLDGYDEDGDMLIYNILPSSHTLRIRGSVSNYTYYSAADFTGEDSFLYSVSDGIEESEPATVTVTVLSNSDVDGDHISNDWEELYFGSNTAADPMGDPDADGLKNLAEYAFGGNPTNANDTGTALCIQRAGSLVEFSYALRDDPALAVTVLSCTNLISGPWVTNAVQVGADGSDFSSYTNSLPQEDCLFIKIRVNE